MKKILSLILAILLTFGLFACGGENGSENGSKNADLQVDGNIYNLNTEVKAGVYKGDKKRVQGKYVIAQNKSNYKIVVSSEATQNEMFAAGELQTLLLESTGFRLPIVSEADIVKGDNYFSIGHTVFFNRTRNEITYEEYHRSGYRLFTENGNIFICGAKESQAYGTLYGVYEYLSQVLGYECYSQNCYVIDKVLVVPYYEMDITIIPQIESRCVRYDWTFKDSLFNTRMKMVNRFVNQTDWILDGHTNLVLLPYETYGAEHPEWYMNNKSDNGNQLCLTNDEMRAEYVKKVKERIVGNDAGVYFMLSNMDNYDYCTCDACRAEIERCG
ncbi:MAG: DUF4838 domain-containing protein, partial [Clostridia bacterium]|nr:DUF4838 domain-containing protein [Clostridia bacterium]